LRHEEKLLKKKKKSKNRFGRFVFILILVIAFLILAFYFLNNPSAFDSIKNKLLSFYTSQSAGDLDSAASTGKAGTTLVTENDKSTGGQDNTDSVSGIGADTSGTTSDSSSSEHNEAASESAGSQVSGAAVQSLWQKIISFFKQKIDSQGDNFPGALNIKIYFAALGQDETFVFEERRINAGSPQVAVENTVQELLKGPSKSFHYPVIPPGTKLLGVQIYENLAKIDFSQEFLENSLDSGILDDYVIYTIVDTVTQIPGVEGVIFLIDGKRIKLYGSVDTSIPLIKNEKYLPAENNEGTGA
jgi:spore germination protein GerM